MSRQFRSDDTELWPYMFGSGSDGTWSSSGSTTFSAANASCSGTSGTTSLTLGGASSFANGDLVLIHQTRGTGAGNYEFNAIVSGAGTTSITLALKLQNTYTDSGNSQAQVLELKQYTSFTQNSGHTMSIPNWDENTGGIIAFLCRGTTTIDGTLSAIGGAGTGPWGPGNYIYGGYGGYEGGNADTFNGYTNATTAEGTTGAKVIGQLTANGSGGGTGNISGGSGGGGGGNASAGDNGTGGATTYGGNSAGNAGLTTMVFGGGGGGGFGGWSNSYAGSGGAGGGIILIITRTLSITGTINLYGGKGGDGLQPGTDGQVAGGGGAGGSCLIKCVSATLGSNKIQAYGGARGEGDRDGGAGSTGRVHIDYYDTYSGSSNPTIDARKDAYLGANPAASIFF